MTAAATGNNADLTLNRCISSDDVVRVEMELYKIGKCGAEAGHGLENDVLGGINEFFHNNGGVDDPGKARSQSTSSRTKPANRYSMRPRLDVKLDFVSFCRPIDNA